MFCNTTIYSYPRTDFDSLFKEFVWFGNDTVKSLKKNRVTAGTFTQESDGTVSVWTLDLPGVKREDVELEVYEGEKLLLTAKRKDQKQEYVVTPGKDYDVTRASATLELGVLEVRFPRKEVVRQKIEVK